VLEPGDALYLPRGWLHAAAAEGHRSLHLTVGMRGPTRYTVVEELLGMAATEPTLRAGLPLGTDLGEPDDLRPHLAATVSALRAWLDTVAVDDVAAAVRRRLSGTSRPAPLRPLAQLDAVEGVGPDTVLRLRPGLAARLVPGDGRARLHLGDRTVEMPAACVPAVRRLLDGDPVRAGDLPGLDAAGQLVLARRLLREAVAVPA
jgi:lysine-specific demethylase/histidyl-hydroxylase NO66